MNYYQLGATLSGHTDHSEDDLTAPLISIRCVYVHFNTTVYDKYGVFNYMLMYVLLE